MNIGSRIASLLALSTLLTVSAESSYAQTVDPPFNRMISDFGPRNVTGGSFFHRGIDYNPQAGNTRGTPIPSVEAGVVAGAGLHGRTGIRFSQDIWLIDVVGPLGSFQYMHIFETDPAPTPEAWQISGAFALGAIVDGAGRTVYFIVRYTDETRTTVADAFIDDDHSGTEILPGIYAASPVEARRLIAPIGASGVGDPHLHLGLNLTQDNPLYHVRHTPDGLPTAVVEAPTPNMVFTQEQLASPYALKVRINSLGAASIEDRTFGLDLDKVSLYILRKGDPLQPIHLGTVGQPTYSYGGRPEEDATDTATRRPTTSLSGVDPQGNVAGDDRMVFLVNLQTVDNGNPLPDGNHILEVRCRDVNDHPACLEADGSYTRQSFPIADPYSLVENEKLIFSGLAQKTRHNWGSRSFTIAFCGGEISPYIAGNGQAQA